MASRPMLAGAATNSSQSGTAMPCLRPMPIRGSARAVLAVVEGAQMLRAVGRGDVGEAGLAALEG